MSEGAPQRTGGPAGGAPGSDPALLARIQRFQIEVDGVVQGLRSGHHRSRRRGEGLVFAEHVDYRAGDDLRRLDWRAYARSDHYRLKRFEHEVELRAALALDVSGSMGYGEGAQNKHWHGAVLLGALGHLLSGRGDAVGVARFDGQLSEWIAPRAGSQALAQGLTTLALPPRQTAPTSLAESLAMLTERVPERGLVAIASDLLDLSESALASLARLRARANQVWVLHVLHRDELELPFSGARRFIGCEGEAELEVDADAMRSAYKRQLDAFFDRCRAACNGRNVRYVLAPTDEDPGETLSTLLRAGGGRAWA